MTVALVTPALAADRAAEAPGPADSLRRLVHSARHESLRWPAFPDFRTEIGRLYERAAWEPLWIQGSRPSVAAIGLIARLAAADTLGLDPSDYDAAWLERQADGLLSAGSRATQVERVRFDVGLSIAAVRFVSALHRGRVSPRQVQAQLFVPRSFLAVEMVVDSLRDSSLQESLLERVQPRLHHYQLLKNGLARYRMMERDSSLVPLVALPRVLKPGMHLPAAAQLRSLLEATGDMRRGDPRRAVDSVYSGDLVAGVRRFQTRQGFEPDGKIGQLTAASLNRPFAQRVRQIELALERFRWLPASIPLPPIIVNIPAFRLYAFRGATDHEDQMLAMDIVVGGAFDRRTPVFAADLRYLIFRPFWELPQSIVKAEVVPRLRTDPGFLERERMVLVEGESADSPELPATRTNIARLGEGTLRMRQRPGAGNALGLLKFILPNASDVYLHDTPAKGLFARARRDLSHGCIRLSDPAALAAHVLRDRPEWTLERVHAAMEGEDDVRIDLKPPVPVLIVYSTAMARENGDVHFYSDIYGLDGELDRLIRMGYPFPK